MTGVGAAKSAPHALHEIHIFVGPIYVSPPGISKEEEEKSKAWKDFQRQVDLYKAMVELWNQLRPVFQERDAGIASHAEMKAPVLTLIFRDGDGEKPVTVCQSARYVRCDDVEKVKEFCHEDAQFFTDQGLTVLREKIEATAYGIQGVPQTAEEAAKFPDLYFEFHIKVQREGDELDAEPKLITEREEKQLRQAANELSRQLDIPIPLSYNREKNQSNLQNGGCQRFLNARFYGKGMREIKPQLNAIQRAIDNLAEEEGEKYRVLKIISEYVWYDTLKTMDHGWIDYSPEELAALKQRLAAAQ